MKKLIIFDLDGTLLDSITDLANSCNYILEEYGFPTHTIQQYKRYVGNGVGKLVERALPEDKRSSEFVEEVRAKFVTFYSEHSTDTTSAYPNIKELLNTLQNEKYLLAVASNKFDSGTKSLVQQYFGDIRWAAVLGQRDGIKTKPDPQIIYDILQQVNMTDKSQILYLGDSDADMKTCVNADIDGVGVTWGFRTEEELLENGAKYIIHDPLDLLNIIQNLK